MVGQGSLAHVRRCNVGGLSCSRRDMQRWRALLLTWGARCNAGREGHHTTLMRCHQRLPFKTSGNLACLSFSWPCCRTSQGIRLSRAPRPARRRSLQKPRPSTPQFATSVARYHTSR
eukprot:365530-Chlamydomonas_euryale.AAC.27